MKRFYLLGLLLSIVPGLAGAAVLTYTINFDLPETWHYAAPTGTFSINSDYQLDGQGRIRQEDILSFEVRAGYRDYLVFDLTDTLESTLGITVYRNQFYFDLRITDNEDLTRFCEPGYDCTAVLHMYSQPEDLWTAYVVSHYALDGVDINGLLEIPSTTPGPVPVPAAAWLFLSGLVGLVGAAKARTHGSA